MTTLMDKLKRTKWFRTRPLVVQKAHDIWSYADRFQIHGEEFYLLGFAETDDSEKSGDPYDLMLILSEVDPTKDYDRAMANKMRMCARHFVKPDAT